VQVRMAIEEVLDRLEEGYTAEDQFQTGRRKSGLILWRLWKWGLRGMGKGRKSGVPENWAVWSLIWERQCVCMREGTRWSEFRFTHQYRVLDQ
jgi:hypothetical protein